MLMRTLLSRGGYATGAIAAVILTLLALASAAGATQSGGVSVPPTPAVADDGSGTGLPPTPGPTNPNGP
jgi:hypothetical protein